ncbi:hypothetical protein CEXT_796321 [Caerostris extrusa]|uniref:Uncharacterized protein n=1 Tax=Caerostris extrusa TaxID=172846 RepID=A0AAV4TLW7_CAEEX|nr:hypothetical protein CEXT_796321 [Caerostris extrusa]
MSNHQSVCSETNDVGAVIQGKAAATWKTPTGVGLLLCTLPTTELSLQTLFEESPLSPGKTNTAAACL